MIPRLRRTSVAFFCGLGAFALTGLAAWIVYAGTPAGTEKDSVPIFEKQLLPVLRSKCLSCHGDKKLKANLDLRTKAAALKGGESGPAIVRGSAEDSLLWVKIATDKMPPGEVKLSAAEKDIIKRWIEGGAPGNDKATTVADAADRQVTDADRQFWAFQKPTRSSIPKVQHAERVRNPIDAFVLAALETKGLTLSPDADRLTLLRRVTFDLTGLPPTPKEIEAFLADKSPEACENVVDRLLASPHYGERWARHWLDLAGYADSEGILDADYVRTAAWRYRDWVIRALNSDKPYDRFLQEQIAGDELVDYWSAYQSQKELGRDVIDALIATGYLRCASDTSRPDFVNIKNAPGYYFQTLDDTVKIVASSTMGLTVQCAKCHSHKYDPIPQSDYYRLQAIFMSGYRPGQWVPQVQRRLLEATSSQEKEAKEHNAKIDGAVAGIKKQLAEVQKPFAERLFTDRLAKLPPQIREDVRAALAVPADKRNEVQKYLAGNFGAELKPKGPALDKELPAAFPDYKTKFDEANKAIQEQEKTRRNFAEIRAFYDLPGEAKTHLLRRGDYLTPGPELTPGTLAVLAATEPFQIKPPEKDAKTSGRRLAFARWLTQPDHPLTGRVMVNRLWHHHFGQGIVATPDNFGHTGAPPSHPELLDWLACEFSVPTHRDRRGAEGEAAPWSLKRMHRLIVTSSAYRQASVLDPVAHAEAKKRDPDNRLLWRQRLRRLDAEAMRDAILAVAGNLKLAMFGAPVPMQRQSDGEVIAPADASGLRRSIYLQVRRSQPLTFLQLFDQPVIETNCTRRETSTVASQALTLLNSDFMVKQAEAFAARVLKESANSPDAHAVLLAFGRSATEKELSKLNAFLDAQAAQQAKTTANEQAEARRRAVVDLCHMLMSANEFAYLD
ncbi:MAG: PSD1 domain-containing protein [Planctomycetes bacterium]|nr:PSD1 domain-containing protein [Planctomycetota bacterium]